MDIIIGNKYVPYAKTIGFSFCNSVWIERNIVERQGFLHPLLRSFIIQKWSTIKKLSV